MYEDIREMFAEFPHAKGYVNCTGLGSFSLKGVEDKDLYPTLVRCLLDAVNAARGVDHQG